MVTIHEADVADALHESGPSDLPDGYQSDIDAAEVIVGKQVEPYVDPGDQELVDQCATYVAAAFIEGTDGAVDGAISQIQRESQTVRFDTGSVSDEAGDFWARAVAFDPTGRLGGDTAEGSGFFEAF